MKVLIKFRGTFPYDMLRYDRCFPASPEDSAKLGDTSIQWKTVTLQCDDHPYAVSWGRWRSFGAEVLKIVDGDREYTIDAQTRYLVQEYMK